MSAFAMLKNAGNGLARSGYFYADIIEIQLGTLGAQSVNCAGN
jgi:hypothetical protein